MNDAPILDPSPEEWLTTDHVDSLRSELGHAVSLMKRAGVLSDVLRCWILRELGETKDDTSEPIAWARNQWGHRLDSLFLQRKDILDEASCRLVRVKQQGLALELYHRLLAQEATFEQVSQQFGLGPERFHGGIFKQQALASYPGNLGQLLRRLESGEISKPLRIGEQFGIIQLKSFVPAVHGEASSLKILQIELKQWVDGMTSHLESLLSSST